MENLMIKQKLILDQINKQFTTYKTESKTRKSSSYLKNALDRVQRAYKAFTGNHNKIIDLLTEQKDMEAPYFSEDMEGEFHEIHLSFKSELEDLLDSLEEANHSKSLNDSANGQKGGDHLDVRLPRISLPTFTGDYESWTSFRDLFKSLIHDRESLSKVEKLHYLKCSLGGEAERLLKQFPITEANYIVAWNLLNDRYDNKNALLSALFKNLMAIGSANETAFSVKLLLDRTVETVQAIENMGIDCLWHALIVYITTQKLPSDSRQIWEQQQASKGNLPSFENLKEFLQNRFRALEAAGLDRKVTPSITQRRNITTLVVDTQSKCILCNQQHLLRQCKKFLELPSLERFNVVKRNGLCINCLFKGHLVSNCTSKSKCLKCNRSHHTLLHREERVETPNASQSDQQPSCSYGGVVGVNSLNIMTHKQVLLATALIHVESANGQVVLRALLDQGSQASFITESAFQRLGLKRKRINATVIGIGKANVTSANGAVEAILYTVDHMPLEFNAFILEKLTNLMPSKVVEQSVWKELEHQDVVLADPHFNHPGKIDMILGADVYAKIIKPEIIKLSFGPILQRTTLGWIISGELKGDTIGRYQSCKVEVIDDPIDDLLRKFWELEELPKERMPTKDEALCEQYYKETTTRQEDGRFIVRLPFKQDNVKTKLGNSRSTALANLLQQEKRFAKDNRLRDEYTRCLGEYMELDHMELVQYEGEHVFQDGKVSCVAHYLPHHAVIKDSTTTKLRVVFDASRKTNSKLSLNDVLMTGPAIQSDMISVVMNWRLHQFVFVADIEKMYRQILVHPEDTHYQRILWRSDTNTAVRDYKLNTVTFGTTCAPYLAIRTLHQLAEEGKATFPNAYDIIKEEFYVDDWLSGGAGLDEAIEKRKNISQLLKSGGFPLRKWVANDPRLLEGIPSQDIEIKAAVDMNLDQGVKSLGILWYPTTDNFGYSINLKTIDSPITKRQLLSDIARLFDPLGWLAPIIILAKILLKEVWKLGTHWDDPLTDDIHASWTRLRNTLKTIEQFRIPRWMYFDNTCHIELHGFCDASEEAYGAAVYLLCRNASVTHVGLVIARAKVSPIKTTTTAKLELCGAVLLCKLITRVQKSLKITKLNTCLWSDSEITLAWIKGEPSRWNIFVANRTTQILEMVGNTTWRYVPFDQNPADIASRGMLPADLFQSQLWWSGPKWLKMDKQHWPRNGDIKDTDEEARKHLLAHHGAIGSSHLNDLLHRFSSLTRLIRVTAYCYRFGRITSEKDKINGYLTTIELQQAFEFWIHYVQELEFMDDINKLRSKQSLSNHSKLLNLNPSLDKNGILRVNGRLSKSNLSSDEIEPIILPRKGRFTELLLDQIHKATQHGATQLMLATLRRRFWLIDARNTIRHFVHKYIRCFKTKAKTSTQLMGQLPAPRVTISRPFTHTGVDYCGPFDIKERRGRGSQYRKAYVAVFICLCTKAMHIELVGDMTTQAFLAAFRRFCGRRGLCAHVYSDCGTNFVGADAELRRVVKENNKIGESLANEGVTWHFNPPASPHFGGLWEAGVKSIKGHLRRIVGNSSLTFEEFTTTLVQIEACLNSRPLCPLTDDPTDLTALTPAHFLVGDTLLSIPETNLMDEKLNRLDRWQLTQRLAQAFWRRWIDEYLTRLQHRPKWLSRERNLTVGDICLVKDERFPSYKWPLGRILETHPGSDGMVRVVTVRTQQSTSKRPIAKIALLPIDKAD